MEQLLLWILLIMLVVYLAGSVVYVYVLVHMSKQYQGTIGTLLDENKVASKRLAELALAKNVYDVKDPVKDTGYVKTQPEFVPLDSAEANAFDKMISEQLNLEGNEAVNG